MNQVVENLVPICIYCLNCTKFGQLIPRKIIEIVATRCQILRLKCTKFNFGGGAYSTPPDPLAKFKEPTSNGSKGEGRERWGGKRRARLPNVYGGKNILNFSIILNKYYKSI